jgi:hypothetical protein
MRTRAESAYLIVQLQASALGRPWRLSVCPPPPPHEIISRIEPHGQIPQNSVRTLCHCKPYHSPAPHSSVACRIRRVQRAEQSSWLQTQRSRVLPSASRFSEYRWVWNGVHSALVRVNEELLERKVTTPVYKTEIYDRKGSAALTTRHPSIHKSWP